MPITERSPEMLLLMAGLAMLTMGCQHAAAPERMAASSPEVTVAKPERRVLALSTTQPGRIEAFEKTPLFAKVAGYVEEVRIDIGDVVQKNQVLVRLAVPELLDAIVLRLPTFHVGIGPDEPGVDLRDPRLGGLRRRAAGRDL